MAVTPIEIFQAPQTGLLGLLGGIQTALASGLNNAIQVGRNLADNASASERDLLGEQRNEIAMDQRKAEFAQGQLNTDRAFDESVRRDDRNFARDVLEDERDFGMDVARTNRAAANDALQLSSNLDSAERANRRLDLEEKRITAETDADERDRQFNRDLLGSDTPDSGIPFTGPPAPVSPGVRAAEAEARAKAARELGNADAYKAALRDKAAAEAEEGYKPTRTELTPSEELARERLDFSKDQAAKSEENRKETSAVKQTAERQKTLVTDPDAFPPPTKFARQKLAGLDPDKAADKAAIAAAEADYEAAAAAGKDPVAYETNAALSMGEQEYVQAVLPKDSEGKRVGTVSEAVAKKRRSFWRNAKKLAAEEVAVETSKIAEDDEEDAYDAFLTPK